MSSAEVNAQKVYNLFRKFTTATHNWASVEQFFAKECSSSRTLYILMITIIKSLNRCFSFLMFQPLVQVLRPSQRQLPLKPLRLQFRLKKKDSDLKEDFLLFK